MGDQEARFIVDQYYQIQEFRKASANQDRALEAGDLPHTLQTWYTAQLVGFETDLKKALDKFSANHPLASVVRGVCGIGPVISAGLVAHINIHRAPTAGHIWSFAGLNPSVKWEKGKKRPWNADLKKLCFLIGESFIKVQNNDGDEYGHLFRVYKDELSEKNACGEFAEAAATKLATTKIGKTTEAFGHYSAGHLPPAHVHARARRWVVKLFLSDYHHAACRIILKKDPPIPYVLAHCPGHTHEWRAEWLKGL